VLGYPEAGLRLQFTCISSRPLSSD
jgi:hypothetical protein